MLRPVIACFFTMSMLLCVGCASHDKSTGPVTPDAVKFYTKAPSGDVQRLGMISVPVTPDIRWDDRGDSPKGIMAMREKAAAMGANGILTDISAGDYDITALVGDGKGNWYQVPIKTGAQRTAVGMAIRVD